nr:unnamed protein product [Fasciola hepatica]CAK6928356.1 unnamed protein product [Fasciola hepatica]
MLPPNQGYRKAREILKDLFGQTHVVARSLLNGLLSAVMPNADDAESLTKLAIKMQSCEIALSQLEYDADLNSVVTLERVVRMLSRPLQHRWARLVDETSETSGVPNFKQLMSFVAAEARIARSRFGQIALSATAKPLVPPRNSAYRSDRQVNFTCSKFMSRKEQTCIVCKEGHNADSCSKFAAMEVSDRWNSLRRNGGCFVCLQEGHRAAECTLATVCGKFGCSARHHELLHRDKLSVACPETYQCAANRTTGYDVALGIIPVKISGPKGTALTYALIDNGSDVSLVEKGLVEQVGLSQVTSCVTIRTVSGLSKMESGVVNLCVVSSDDSANVSVERALCVNRLFSKSPRMDLRSVKGRWPHLSDVPVERTGEVKVGVLIGSDVPEAHWVLEQRIGNRSEPYAVKTRLGWMILGPLGPSNDRESTVNNLIKEQNTISEQLRRLYDADFSDKESTKQAPSLEGQKALSIAERSLKLVDGHYQLALSWKTIAETMPNNYEVAARRLHLLVRRFQRDRAFYERYEMVMLGNRDKWISDPEFWRLPRARWPTILPNADMTTEIEFKKPTVDVNLISREPNPLFVKFPIWTKPLKFMAWLVRFKDYLLYRMSTKTRIEVSVGRITLDEIRKAEHDIVREVQSSEFADDLSRLKSNASKPWKSRRSESGHLKTLCPVIIDEIMCVGGRLDYCNHEPSFKHPAILPKGHPVTDLIIRHYHAMEGHCGTSQNRSAQQMAPLPPMRAEAGWYPFHEVGVDYFGPFPVRRGRSTEKRYGCLFSCLQTRAIHIEVAHSLTSDGNQGCLYTKKWRQVIHLAAVFWRRWTKEYVPLLHKRQKWISKDRNLKVGDLVMIASDIEPRKQWPPGDRRRM